MALLGAYIDSRTSTAQTSGSTGSFAHGITGTPDICICQPTATIASATNWWNVYGFTDATNVTLYNAGGANSPTFKVVTLLFHSLIR